MPFPGKKLTQQVHLYVTDKPNLAVRYTALLLHIRYVQGSEPSRPVWDVLWLYLFPYSGQEIKHDAMKTYGEMKV